MYHLLHQWRRSWIVTEVWNLVVFVRKSIQKKGRLFVKQDAITSFTGLVSLVTCCAFLIVLFAPLTCHLSTSELSYSPKILVVFYICCSFNCMVFRSLVSKSICWKHQTLASINISCILCITSWVRFSDPDTLSMVDHCFLLVCFIGFYNLHLEDNLHLEFLKNKKKLAPWRKLALMWNSVRWGNSTKL